MRGPFVDGEPTKEFALITDPDLKMTVSWNLKALELEVRLIAWLFESDIPVSAQELRSLVEVDSSDNLLKNATCPPRIREN